MKTLTVHNQAFAKLCTPLVALRVLDQTDVHVADRLGAIAGVQDPEVLLGAAFAVAAPAGGHTGVALERVHEQVEMARRQARASAGATQAELEAPTLPADPVAWRDSVVMSSLVGRSPADFRPLVWNYGLLQTHRMTMYEERLARALRARARVLPLEPTQRMALRGALTRLAGSFSREPEQEAAAAVAAMCALSVITGGPGTGKTTTVRKVLLALRAALQQPDLRVALAAPTGKAAARMREALLAPPPAGHSDGLTDDERQWLGKLQTSTLHRLLGYQPRTPSRYRHNADNPLAYQLIVVDEASMIDVAMMCKLVEATPPDTRLVLLGDRNQLASVDAGSVLADVTQLPDDSAGMSPLLRELVSEVVGEGSAPPALATRPDALAECMVRFFKAFRFEAAALGRVIYGVAAASALPEGSEAEKQQVRNVLQQLQAPDATAVLALLPHAEKARGWDPKLVEQAANAYRDALAPLFPPGRPASTSAEVEALQAIDKVRVLAAHREGPFGVSGLNAQLTEAVQGLLQLSNSERRQRWWPGRLVLVTQNDYENNLWNGDIGIVLRGGERADVLFAGPDGPRKVPAAALPAHETAFAMTIHKSQGSQFGHVYVVLPKEDSRLLSRELLYTAMSRARSQLTVSGDAKLLEQALLRRVQRATALGARLWNT